MEDSNKNANGEKKHPAGSAATGTGPAQPWDKQGRTPDEVNEDEPRKASGVRKSGDRKPDQDNEDELEDALEQTFPASDPVSAEQIVKPGKPPNRG